jgi:hypothetical protein
MLGAAFGPLCEVADHVRDAAFDPAVFRAGAMDAVFSSVRGDTPTRRAAAGVPSLAGCPAASRSTLVALSGTGPIWLTLSTDFAGGMGVLPGSDVARLAPRSAHSPKSVTA